MNDKFLFYLALIVTTVPMMLWDGAASAASMTTLGTTDARDCFLQSLLPASGQALEPCDHAIANGGLSVHDLAATYSNRGIIYAGTGRYERALEDQNTAIKLLPSLAQAYINRGNAYYHLQQYDKALVDFEQSISLNVTPLETAWFNKALTLIKMKRTQEARDALKQALKIAPDSERIQDKLSELNNED